MKQAILAGEMKNAWQVEDRPNQPDTRPAGLKQGEWNFRSRQYRENYDRVFGPKHGGHDAGKN